VDFMTKTGVRRGYPLQTGEIGEGWKNITEKGSQAPAPLRGQVGKGRYFPMPTCHRANVPPLFA